MNSKKNPIQPAKSPSKKGAKPLHAPASAPAKTKLSRPPVRKAESMPGTAQHSVTRNPSVQGLTSGPRGVGLSAAAMLYAKAMCNPFGEFEELPCVPASPPSETYRFRALQRYSFTTGTLGYGFVTYDPTVPGNNAAYLQCSSSTFAGTGFAEAPGTGIISLSNQKLPFETVMFTTGESTFSYRLVAAGLRIRNVTQALNVGGVLLGIRLPGEEDNSISQFSFSETAQSPYAVFQSSALDKQSEWKTLVWVPTVTGQLSLSDWDADVFKPTLGFLVQAPAPDVPQTFEIETIQFFEYGGQWTQAESEQSLPSVEVSYADTVGLDRVLHGASYLVPALSDAENRTNMANGVVEAFAHSDSTAKTVEDLLNSVGKSLLSASKLAATLIKWLAI